MHTNSRNQWVWECKGWEANRWGNPFLLTLASNLTQRIAEHPSGRTLPPQTEAWASTVNTVWALSSLESNPLRNNSQQGTMALETTKCNLSSPCLISPVVQLVSLLAAVLITQSLQNNSTWWKVRREPHTKHRKSECQLTNNWGLAQRIDASKYQASRSSKQWIRPISRCSRLMASRSWGCRRASGAGVVGDEWALLDWYKWDECNRI